MKMGKYILIGISIEVDKQARNNFQKKIKTFSAPLSI